MTLTEKELKTKVRKAWKLIGEERCIALVRLMAGHWDELSVGEKINAAVEVARSQGQQHYWEGRRDGLNGK